MNDTLLEFGSQEVQSIIPIKIKYKTEVDKKEDKTEGEKWVDKDNFDIFRYLGIESPKKLDKLTLGRIYQISQRISRESDSGLRKNIILQSIEKHMPKMKDSLSRIDNLFLFLKGLDEEGKNIMDLIDKDYYEQIAIQTGNWKPYLNIVGRK